MDDKIAKKAQQTPEELAQERVEKRLAIRALLRTAVPPRIELLKRQPFERVLYRHEKANRDLQRHMQSGLMGKSKRQTGEAFQALVDAIATCAFAEDGVTIAEEHFKDVHPEVEAARKRGRVLSFEGLLGFFAALTGYTPPEPAPPPVLVSGMPPELRDDSSEDALARRRAKFGTD